MTARVTTGVVVRAFGVSVRVAPRTLVVVAVLAALAAVVSVLSMTVGQVSLSPGEVVAALFGGGTPVSEMVVLRLRLPRALTGLLAGAALAVSGALLQSITRNVLGSPDFIGITTGSATGALITIIVLGGGMHQTSLGALVGGLATAAVMYALVLRRGLQGFRFVLVGVGVAALLLAVNYYLITRADIYDAVAAQEWLTGSLNLRTWPQVIAIAVTVALLLPLGALWSRRLTAMEMGDPIAGALGVPLVPTRLVLIGAATGLAAVATAATGPIAFVALAAPQLARAVTRANGPAVLTSALMGAVLLGASDFAVQRIFGTAQLPVGIVTSAVGGLYLAWLLAARWRGRT
ncbi:MULTISPECIES: FecCD family ABC transporter permease [Actinokineospora]|uniref:FecCD family ABC transporter permease n=1 Tax=Actinokineospora TaxID=39845 RepID=UPI001E3B575E|nr:MULTISPECIES: iron chelate uptake ABC transporter family permease subunit [Actinokineospora]